MLYAAADASFLNSEIRKFEVFPAGVVMFTYHEVIFQYESSRTF